MCVVMLCNIFIYLVIINCDINIIITKYNLYKYNLIIVETKLIKIENYK